MYERIEHIVCEEPGCENSLKDTYWNKVKASGWFHQKDGTSWCPEHTPEWLHAWRKRRKASQ